MYRFQIVTCTVALTIVSALGAGAQSGAGAPDKPRSASLTPPTLLQVYRGAHRDAERRYREAQAAADSVSARGVREYMVPVARGRMTVWTSAARTDDATAALAVADSLLQLTVFANATTDPIAFRYHASYDLPSGASPDSAVWFLDRVIEGSADEHLTWWARPLSPPTLGQALAGREGVRLSRRLPGLIQRWLNSDLGARNLPDRWSSVYMALASSSTVVSRSCLLGDMRSCREVLLIAVPDDRLLEWYTPGARRALVMSLQHESLAWRRQVVDGDLPGTLSACVSQHDDAACTSIIRRHFETDTYSDPLRDNSGREALIVTAVDMPGAPGLAAVLGRPDLGVEASIAAISGTTVDSVLREWHRRMAASQPDTVEIPVARVLSALAWTIGLCTLALGGSRWRSA